MKKKDLINFEGKWKGKEKDSNGFGGREMQFLELAERLILFLLLLWLFLIPFENRARAADSTVVESVSIDSVSYTHLDVYKRQIPERYFRLSLKLLGNVADANL